MVARPFAFAVLAVLLAGPAAAESSFGVDACLEEAPLLPAVEAHSAPRVAYVREARIHMVDDARWRDDTFRIGIYWYAWHRGYWYRSTSWSGPFKAVDSRLVPAAVDRVPAERWKRHPLGAGAARRTVAAAVAQDPCDATVVCPDEAPIKR